MKLTQDKPGLLVIGAGPAGLTAATHGNLEGVCTSPIVFDSRPFAGGDIATATWVENVANQGGPATGRAIAANFIQAAGNNHAKIFLGRTVAGIQLEGYSDADTRPMLEVLTDEGLVSYSGMAVVIAIGRSNKTSLDGTPGIASFINRGILYGTPDVDNLDIYKDKHCVVVGGGNGAGQTALTLSQVSGTEVHLVIRSHDIRKNMSYYLIQELMRSNVKIHLGSKIGEAFGDDSLQHVTIVDAEDSDIASTHTADLMFILAGGKPDTTWLKNSVKTDEGFIVTGTYMSPEDSAEFRDNYGRPPQPHETSIAGVFGAGDAVCRSVGRALCAAADGAAVIPEIYRLRNS